ncbi:MAG: ATP phosphoribosyltransferase regulatory subunit [Clostridia bacterium]|nr:ATP phosphoribosyltransferase regulatory subunit [Clostridia bacterium]
MKTLLDRERAVAALGELYESFGYTRFRISKFEEYDLYVRNKDFLVSDSVITFTDTDGRLLALKPDVTLSIIKNTPSDGVHKLFYNENVYRVTKSTRSFGEIAQTGLECIGEVDGYCLYEVLLLACRSLKKIAPAFVLDVAHLGIVSDVLDSLGASAPLREKLTKCLGGKNAHEIVTLCRENGIKEEKADLLRRLCGCPQTPYEALKELASFPEGSFDRAHLEVLKTLCGALKKSGFEKNVHIDFSVINDMNYYNGIVFKGFVENIPAGILSGGQYDKLVKRMGKNASAVGFAVYLDMLENRAEESGYDAVLIYKNSDDPGLVSAKADELRKQKKRVLVSKSAPEGEKCAETVTLDAGKED